MTSRPPASDAAATVLPALTQQLHRFFHGMDARRYEDMLALFTDDARWLRQGQWLVGKPAIEAALRARPADQDTRHLASNAHVAELDGDRAVLEACMTAYRYPAATEGVLPTSTGPLRLNRTTTVFRRDPGQDWRIAEQRAWVPALDLAGIDRVNRIPALPPAFAHRTPATRLVLGAGAIDALRTELPQLGIRRPMLLAGARTQASALFARVLAALDGQACVRADAVPAHSSSGLVERLASLARETGVDGFIAVGGGSASDTAKAVALLLAEGGRLADHAVRFTPPATLVAPPLRADKLPIVAVPGTASGAEVTASLGVRDDASLAKLLFTDVRLAARLVLIDPNANLEVPAALMCATGMNGLAHCIEGLYSRERSPLAETLALDAAARFAEALPAVHRDPGDAAARARLLYAAHLSGRVLLNARTCLHHAICHAIGAVAGVGHGDANAVLLPHSVAFNADGATPDTAQALARAAASLGAPAEPGALAPALVALQAAAGVPTRLRDIGVPATSLDRIAAKTMGERGLHYNPRPVSGAHELRALLDAAF